jgi:hypothetical protein
MGERTRLAKEREIVEKIYEIIGKKKEACNEYYLGNKEIIGYYD